MSDRDLMSLMSAVIYAANHRINMSRQEAVNAAKGLLEIVSFGPEVHPSKRL